MGLLFAPIFYMTAYFLFVSIQFGHDPAVKEQTMQSAGACYKVSPWLEVAAYRFFEPARLCDAYYFRPKLWEDRRKPVTTSQNKIVSFQPFLMVVWNHEIHYEKLIKKSIDFINC